MAFEDWEQDAQGNIVINPFTGADTFVPFGMMCGLRLAYVTSPAMLATEERRFLPLVMTPTQARELAAMLTNVANTAEKPASPEETRQ